MNKLHSSIKLKPISRQLLTGFGISLILVGIVTLTMNYFLIQSDLQRQVQRRAESITRSLQLSSEGLIEIGYTTLLERVVINYATLPDVEEVAIVDPDGKTVTHSMVTQINRPYEEIHPQLAPVIEQVATTGKETNQRLMLNDQPMLVEILPFSSQMFGTTSNRGLAIAIINLQKMEQEAKRTFFTSTATLLIGMLMILIFMAILIHRLILNPLYGLNQSVRNSQETGDFQFPQGIPKNEIQYLAQTFHSVFKQLATYEQLEQEMIQRKQVEAALRLSETKEKAKSQQLEQTLQELKQMQLQLIQTEKMSSLGQMVAGIAHELNNPVNFIFNNLDHASNYVNDLLELVKLYQEIYGDDHEEIQDLIQAIELEFLEEDLAKLLNSMKVGSQRIHNIVLSLRTFSRLDESELKSVNIHDDIESTLLIIQNRLKITKKGTGELAEPIPINIQKNYGELPLIECYPGQLNQVLMNLLVNAIDAVQNTENPTIIITTKQINEQNITISIKDNGEGIKDEIKPRLFDPFFTTKPVGSGTGLGLSISYNIIVNKHQGQIDIISQVDEGTEFIITIPLTQS